jgi:hypothetical protein
MWPILPDVGTSKFKPFEILAQEFQKVATSYKTADSAEERRHLLAAMRLIIDEADSLHKFYTIQYPHDLK